MAMQQRAAAKSNEIATNHHGMDRTWLSLDRTRSGRVDFHPRFSGLHEAPLRPHDGHLKLHVFLDTSSIEAFANDGEAIVTGLIFPSSGDRKLELFSISDALTVKALDVWELKTNWR